AATGQAPVTAGTTAAPESNRIAGARTQSASAKHAASEQTTRGEHGPTRLPFAFAKRHGVMLGRDLGTALEIVCRGQPGQLALVEIRRHAARPIRLRNVDQ